VHQGGNGYGLTARGGATSLAAIVAFFNDQHVHPIEAAEVFVLTQDGLIWHIRS
jgi:hypothetical protein